MSVPIHKESAHVQDAPLSLSLLHGMTGLRAEAKRIQSAVLHLHLHCCCRAQEMRKRCIVVKCYCPTGNVGGNGHAIGGRQSRNTLPQPIRSDQHWDNPLHQVNALDPISIARAHQPLSTSWHRPRSPLPSKHRAC